MTARDTHTAAADQQTLLARCYVALAEVDYDLHTWSEEQALGWATSAFLAGMPCVDVDEALTRFEATR